MHFYIAKSSLSQELRRRKIPRFVNIILPFNKVRKTARWSQSWRSNHSTSLFKQTKNDEEKKRNQHIFIRIFTFPPIILDDEYLSRHSLSACCIASPVTIYFPASPLFAIFPLTICCIFSREKRTIASIPECGKKRHGTDATECFSKERRVVIQANLIGKYVVIIFRT